MTQEIEPLQAKYHKFVDHEPEEDSNRILKRDFNFLESMSGFEKVETLGKGAYAKVYHVKQKKTQESFALKVYPKSYLTKPHRITNIRSEIFLLSNVKHPHIVSLLNVYESDDNVKIKTNPDLPSHEKE